MSAPPDPLFDALQAQIARERGPSAWLKSRPTWMRLAFAVAAILGVVLFALLVVPRADLSEFPRDRMASTVVLLLVLLSLSLHYGLRAMHRKAPPGWLSRTFAVGVLGLLLLTVLNPLSYQPPSKLHDHSFLGLTGLRCLAFGCALGLPVYALMRVLDRGAFPEAATFAATAAGLTGFFALHMHCPMVAPLHLLLGHAAVLLAFFAFVWVRDRH